MDEGDGSDGQGPDSCAAEPAAGAPSRTEMDAACASSTASWSTAAPARPTAMRRCGRSWNAGLRRRVAAGRVRAPTAAPPRQRGDGPPEQPIVKLADPVDKYALGPLPDIDAGAHADVQGALLQADGLCSVTIRRARRPLGVLAALSAAQRDDGYRAHSEPDTFRCTIYAHRPASAAPTTAAKTVASGATSAAASPSTANTDAVRDRRRGSRDATRGTPPPTAETDAAILGPIELAHAIAELHEAAQMKRRPPGCAR